MSYITKVLDPSSDRGACSRGHSVGTLKGPRNWGYRVSLTIPGYVLPFSLNGKDLNIHIFVLTNEEEMRSPLSK